jgi:hypothetical protein
MVGSAACSVVMGESRRPREVGGRKLAMSVGRGVSMERSWKGMGLMRERSWEMGAEGELREVGMRLGKCLVRAAMMMGSLMLLLL